MSVSVLLAAVTVAQSPAQRAAALLAKMDLSDKIRMLHGTELDDVEDHYVGEIKGNEKLKIPDIRMNDGPQGFRTTYHPGTSTQWPSGLGIAATWDVNAVTEWASNMADEFVTKGADILLGPAVCVARVPVNGRNFEYISGEDPKLGATLVAPVVQAIQKKGVMANLKHFILNNQETDRTTSSSDVDERTLHEIYSPPFESAVKAGVLTVMCSYNLINGEHSCQHNSTLRTLLREQWGYKGWVMSDWMATHSVKDAAMNGLDQEMPMGLHFGEPLEIEVRENRIPEKVVDEKVMNILTSMFEIGMFNRSKFPGTPATNATSTAHMQSAANLASEAAILLKNDKQLLPLPTSLANIAVFNAPASSKPITGGKGSGAVAPSHRTTILEAIKRRLPNATVTYYDGDDQQKIVELAKASDASIVVLATISGEGKDRVNLSFPENEIATAKLVSQNQPKTVAVGITPGAVLTNWDSTIPSVVLMIMPGQEEGTAASNIIFGDVNPSGRLPMTLPNIENEVQFTPSQYPGINKHSNYSERLNVGYRWYNTHSVVPKYPFGHGMSYTTFAYSNMTVHSDTDDEVVCFNVANTGHRSGKEVPQMYLTFPVSSGEPPSQLKGFQKITLQAGQTQQVCLTLSVRDRSIYDVSSSSWVLQKGNFTVGIGSSVLDIHLRETLTL
eukprot:TRINITY_DN335_c16_g1_i1.p1 TRINITY_DN335_c16_g1~~TRINITY_DN335_c16_g1_i1.p1  ORF type:complete len:672 (+),score=131.14 TRINITY_DN335_c16_g1_i1:45-2060(+)